MLYLFLHIWILHYVIYWIMSTVVTVVYMCNSTSNRSSSFHATQRSADSFSPLQVGWALLVLFEPGAKAQDDDNQKYLPSQDTLHAIALYVLHRQFVLMMSKSLPNEDWDTVQQNLHVPGSGASQA